MPKFLLILRGDTQADYSQFTPEDFARILGEYAAWGERMAKEGRLEMGHKLTDEGGRVIWPKAKGKVEVKDGPYVETKEVVGGLTILEAADLDAALGWGGRLAEATGVPVEVRPFAPGAS